MAERVTFQLAANTDVALLMAEREELRPFEPVVRDMLEIDGYGLVMAEIDHNDALDEDGRVVGGDSRIYVMAFPGDDRSAIVTNGSVVWVDGDDIDHVARAFREAA